MQYHDQSRSFPIKTQSLYEFTTFSIKYFLTSTFQKQIETYIYCSDCCFTPFTCFFHCFVFTIPSFSLRFLTTEQGVLQVIIFDIFACLCLGRITELGMHNEHFTQVKFMSVFRFRCFVCWMDEFTAQLSMKCWHIRSLN